ncbi:Kelch repeat-containing protein [Desulforegula conservatrix]|uniref:hypothetical protein n=1 Tax=Desulforegula conservatrix TaxID=153026 RepID=UPI00041B0D55|nr:hypothetical protein [Desulforegula conservatrix]
MGSSFPAQSGIPGVRLVAKSKIDNVNYFENLNLLGDDWGSAFVSPMNTLFGTGNSTFSKYSPWDASISSGPAVAVNGKLYTPGSTTQRPDVYDTSTDVWSDSGLAYPDLNDLLVGQFTGSFDYEGNCYYYSNKISITDPVNSSFNFRKYDPVSNTFTALASLPASPTNLKAAMYAYMGSSGGYGYFMQVVKNAVGTYVPSNFPTIYRYHYASNVWSDLAVVPPVVASGVGAGSDTHTQMMLKTNSMSCKYSSTKFLVNFKISKLENYARGALSNNIFLFDTATNQFIRFCNFLFNINQPGIRSDSGHYLISDTRMFYQNGVLYLWSPLFKGLMAYVEATGRQYHVPMAATALLDPMIAFSDGKIYIWGGNLGDSSTTVASKIHNTSGLKIDLVKLSAFLKSSKTIGIKMPVFA